MGRFDTTKATINANIKSNGNQEITGSVLNSVLQEIVDGTDAQLTELSEEIGEYEDNSEYIRAYTDAEGKFLLGIKVDGSIEWSKGVPMPIEKQLLKIFGMVGEYDSNDEYIRAYTDKDGNFLWGIKHDGSIEWAKGIPSPIKDFISEMDTPVSQEKDVEERIEMTLDAENKVVAYRDKNGVLHESKIAISKSISLTDTAITELKKDLIASGFNMETPMDWSNASTIKLPIPRYCAKVNIISNTGLATTKVDDKKCILEYWDKSGNYFKKYIILNAQGSSSMAYIEKNQSIDLFNDEACEENCEIIFDNWVSQDSFHLKCYYIDVFRGIANVGYNFAESIIKYMDSRNNRVIFDSSATTLDNSTGDFNTDFGDGALCHPDGFPFELYVNGEYYGLYAWNLKKHRKNYSMNKKDYANALLDGAIGYNTFFCGNIDWTEFELRNPKDLVTMSGAEYDGENPQELIDETSSEYNSSNSTHVKTAQTKALVQRIANAVPQIIAASEDDAKIIFESYFDKKAMIAYFIGSNVLYHYDGFHKNWIWTIYNNLAAPSFYDLDSIFGRHWNGTCIEPNSIDEICGILSHLPTGQLVRLYKSEIDEWYQSMRNNGIISVESIMHYVKEWIARVGIDAYKKNLAKWTSIPSYRFEKNMNDGSADGGFFDSAKRIEIWLSQRLARLDEYFNL